MAKDNRNGRRVVITGIGALTPLGNTVEEFWQGCVEGRSGIGWITLFDNSAYPVKVDGEVRNFDPQDYMDRKEARRMARFSQFSVAAARMAIEDSGLKLEREDTTRIGVLMGNGNGGYPETDEAMRTILTKGGNRLDPFYMAKTLPNIAAAQVAMQFGLRGYNNTVTTACAASTQALGDALDVIRLGRADVMVAGGGEAGICELGLAAFHIMRALSTRSDDPLRASRPFDANRDGFVCAEGAAVFILESLEHALRRDARIIAELAGYGATSDAYHVVAPCADGEGAQRAMRQAIEDAGLQPEDIDYINAHGTSTPANDSSETFAIKGVFGERAYTIPVSSTKSMIGHTLGASGAIESVACVKAIETGIVPPTINYETPDPECDLDYVPNQSRRVGDVRAVLKNSFGFGGQNACLVFKRYEP
ncbi:MAG TPA: beta-ketoacyl-ACP synthase II [Dehalococcoidia bacterium]|nr:beta-ketoacyl-ACP synthase II [Dehalococcoidia bacterium]